MVGQPPNPSPMWALAVKPARLVSSSPVTWKASSNEQPKRERSSVAANRRCCHRAAALAHAGCQLSAGSGIVEALPDGPMQGMGTEGDPVLSPLGGEGGLSLPTAAPGQAGNAPGLHRGPPATAQRTKVLAAGCRSLAGMRWAHPGGRAHGAGNSPVPGCWDLAGTHPSLHMARLRLQPGWSSCPGQSRLGATPGPTALAVRTLLLISSLNLFMASSNPSSLCQCCAPAQQCCALPGAYSRSMLGERELVPSNSQGMRVSMGTSSDGQQDSCQSV